MPAHLKVQLLGEFALSLDGAPHAAIDTVRLRTLLAYLVMKRGTQLSRARLAYTFWPDSTEKQALTNFRHLLHELRKALPDADAYIEANAKVICWREDAGLELDVEQFEEAAAAACRDGGKGAGAAARFERVLELYGGEFLPGHYDEWAEETRDRLRLAFLDTLQAAVSFHEAARAYGEAIRFAQRMRQLEPGREQTYALLMRLYSLSGDRAKALEAYRDCEAVLRKELDVAPSEATSELYRKLLREEPLAQPAQAAAARVAEPELPLQGRHAEWRQLQEAWADALSGRSQLVVLIGEAGIGKSRLAEELYVSLARQGVAACRSRSYAAEGRLAYAPVCQWMRSEALRPGLATLEPVWLAELARILPELRTEFPDLLAAAGGEGNWQRHLLFEALSRAVLAKQEPLMLLLDDMQWTDLESLEWLRFLLRFAPRGRLLVTGTIREEEFGQEHPLRRSMQELGRDGQLVEIPLGPISEEEVGGIAAGIAGHALSAKELARLVETTEGNPLFVVESVRAGLRSRSEHSMDSYEGLDLTTTLPAKVHAVFATRLGQLSGAALELSRVAAVFGRAFTLDMLVDVSGKSEDEAIALLDELWEKRILREQDAGLYDFTHDKLREVTYEQISTPKRRLLHKKSSDVLEAFFAEDLDAVRAQLASHYEQSGQLTKAVDAYWKAGLGAKSLNATAEAIRLFEKAIGVLSGLPQSKERLEKELEICTDLGVCQVSEHGYQAPGVQQVYERSRELCSLLDRPTSAPVLRGLALYNLVFGNLHYTRDLMRTLRSYYDENKDEILYVESEYVLGVTSFWLGRFEESKRHLENSLERYDPTQSKVHVALYAQDPKAICLCRLAWSLLLLGKIDQAAAKVREAIAFCKTVDHPHTEGYVLSFGAQMCLMMGDLELAKRCAEGFLVINEDHQLPYWETRSEMMLGYLAVVEEGDRSGLTRMRENFDLCVQRRHTISLSSFLVFFARAYDHLGEPEEGIRILDTLGDALADSDETFYDAELSRVRGELMLKCGGKPEQALALYEKALELAREQGSLLLELRAALSIAKCEEGAKRAGAARKRLVEVLGRFSEGFESVDLRAARAFLA